MLTPLAEWTRLGFLTRTDVPTHHAAIGAGQPATRLKYAAVIAAATP
jgi:hypothetical protein